MVDFRAGQRWRSEAEPELGLGILRAVDERRLEIEFEASGSRRQYAKRTAPLRRVRFEPGDLVRDRSGGRMLVREVEEADGLLVYVGDRRLPEQDLGTIPGSEGPAERVRRGDPDPMAALALREEALGHLHRLRTSPVRGLVGARIGLVPHQVYIASEVSRREAPRVLLADEVGLGKTIEAGLVVHRLLLEGRVERALVVVPEHLVHQWYVELRRRFGLSFRIFDEERCASVEAEGGENPFLEEQLVLCALPLLVDDERRAAQAVAAGWDILVVDEAHHLGWTPREASADYALVERLAARSEGLLLLTGTPAQLGEEGHFARLRLLDPARHGDLERYRAEVAGYAAVARQLEEASVAADAALPDDGSLLGEPVDRVREDEILDRYGPGRVMFRNTRGSVGGFPRRVTIPAPIELATPDPVRLAAIAREIDLRGRRARGEAPAPHDYAGDPRIPWLAALLRRIAPEKALVLMQTPEQCIAVGEALSREVAVKRAVFHEGLTLVQRDRNAAYFAEEDGARILLCSEIGSEGRNFQFAHHLVLFDLPVDPELLEQRIGRLDRIGQTADVTIHVPYVAGSAHEVLCRWYAEGLDAFVRPVADGNAFHERFAARVAALTARRHLADDDGRAADDAAVDELVRESRAFRDELADRLARGRDRLLERSSFRPTEAAALVTEIAVRDADPALADFLQRAFDHLGVEVEDLGNGTLRLSAERLYVDAFPGLPAEGATITFSRDVALRREDVEFVTWDHPMATGAIDLLLGSSSGTYSIVALGAADGSRVAAAAAGPFLVEATFVLESSAPRRLGLDRFLPATPIRLVVDRELEERTAAVAAPTTRLVELRGAVPGPILGQVREEMPEILSRARELAEERAAAIVAGSISAAGAHFEAEARRLEELARLGGAVRGGEVERVRRRGREIAEYLGQASPRLDALRILVVGAGEAARAVAAGG